VLAFDHRCSLFAHGHVLRVPAVRWLGLPAGAGRHFLVDPGTVSVLADRPPGSGAPIGALRLVARRGWFAARPSGTENIYKIYAESFLDQAHRDTIVAQARAIVDHAMGSSA
jgi:phosphoglucomutase